MSPNSHTTHHEKWLNACERLDEAEKLVVSAQGRSRTVLLETIERWGKVRDWHAWEIIHTSARESLDAWEAIITGEPK